MQGQHVSHKMPTLTHSGAGAAFSQNSAVTSRRNAALSHRAAMVPRSVLDESTSGPARARSPLGAFSHDTERRNLDMSIPLGAHSTMSLEVVNEGKAMELVA